MADKPAISSGQELKGSIGLVEVAMLGAGAAMGVSVFSVLAPAAKVGGAGILVSALVAVLPMIVFAIIYAFMASVLPKSGASYEWPRIFIGPFTGFIVAWLRILGSVGALITLALVFVQYASMAVPLPVKPTMFVLLLAVSLVNLRGIQISARLQTAAMFLLIATLAIFVALGVPHVRLGLIGNPFAHGVVPILAAVPLLISLFLGIETATEVGEEVRNAQTVIPRALAIALLLTLIVFMALAFTSLGLLGPARLAVSSAPLIAAGSAGFGALAKPLILVASTLAILKSLNAIFVVFSRYLFAMARSGVLPRRFAAIHPRWGTPYAAVLLAFVCVSAGLFLPQDLVFLFVAISIPTVLKYMSTSACAFVLAWRHPALAAAARFRLRRGTAEGLALAGIACASAILLLGYVADWRPYALIAGWGALGVVYWIAWGRSQP